MDTKLFMVMAKQIAEEKKIPFEQVIEIIEKAIALAYSKDSGRKGQNIKAKIDLKTGDIKFWQERLVVDETICEMKKNTDLKDSALQDSADKKIMFEPEKHILLQEAITIRPDIKLQQILTTPLPCYENYSRIATQIARQVILQETRNIEKENIFQKYINKQGEIITGIIERITPSAVFINLGSTTGFLFKKEQIPGEFYTIGQRVKVLILQVEKDNREATILLSRSHPDFIVKLFSLEVPEINLGQVEIKGIVREAGSRSKVAVHSLFPNIDPIGALVGLKGERIGGVIREIGNKEKIDVLIWTKDEKQLIINALSPAKILSVEIDEESLSLHNKKKALVSVAEEQVSLAIGKQGQNVRLASKMTGYDINIKGITEAVDHKKTANHQTPLG
jgi:N utilization substance protein A